MLVEIIIGLVCAFLAWNCLKKSANYPPGYWGLPLIGYIPLSRRSIEDHLLALKKKHNSNVLIWRLGPHIIVFVLSYKLIKELLNKQEFVDRPQFKMFKLCSEELDNYGLTFRNGLGWHNGRRFSLRLLRDLGMGKSKLVSAMQHEALELVNELKKIAGTPQHLPHAFVVTIVNVIWQMMASIRFSLDNKELLYFEEMISNLLKYVQYIAMDDLFPWMSYIIPSFVLKRVLKIDLYNAFRKKYKEFFVRQIKEHEATLNPDDPRDYIDHYLLEMKKQENDVNSTMSIEDLVACCADLYNAGSETTKATLIWALFFLANHPGIQTRLQKEVDDVLPKGVLASLEDKAKMPYTEAFIHEVLRRSSLVAMGALRVASQDVKVEGYIIPKGAILNPVFAACHFDQNVWDSPEEFRPERFLDSEGKFVNPKDNFIAFSSGKRQCLGESLARMEIFIFLTTIVQSLSILPPPGKSIDLKPVAGNPMNNIPNENQDILITIR